MSHEIIHFPDWCAIIIGQVIFKKAHGDIRMADRRPFPGSAAAVFIFSVFASSVVSAGSPAANTCWKEFVYDNPDTAPIVYGGESRAESVCNALQALPFPAGENCLAKLR